MVCKFFFASLRLCLYFFLDFRNKAYPTIFDKAGAYLYFIVCNHSFNDGNKRTRFDAAYLFLRANKIPILFEDREFENLVIEVAKGKKTKEEITYFLSMELKNT